MKTTAASILVLALTLVGCQSPNGSGGDNPGVIKPEKSTGQPSDNRSSPTTRGTSRAIAEVEGVTVDEAQLNSLLYQSYGLDALLKLVQLNMSKAVAKQRGVTVSPADVEAERKLTVNLALPGQEDVDYDQLVRQLRISRAEFEVVMETNANLRASVRAESEKDVTAEAIANEFNLLYGERVRVRDIPVSNLQEVSEVQRVLAEPNARFEDVARRMGKIPALAQLGGQLPEFARTSTGYSSVFIQAAFALQAGQTSTDPIQDQGFYHVIKVEDRIAPKAVKLDDVRDSVRTQLVIRRSNNLMAELRAQLAQRAVREMTISDPTMRKQFEDRVAAANPKPADKNEVRRSLDEQGARTSTSQIVRAPDGTVVPSNVGSQVGGPNPLVGTGVTTQPTTFPVR